MAVDQELLDALFPEQSHAERVMALATRMENERVDVGGQLLWKFKIEGFVPICPPNVWNKACEKRLLQYAGLFIVMQDTIEAQAKARAAASKSRRRRTSGRKGGAK